MISSPRNAALFLTTSLWVGCSFKDDVAVRSLPALTRHGSNLIRGKAPPTALGYAHNPIVYAKGREIEPNEPNSEGGMTTEYPNSPSLPDGLTLSSSTGVLTGTPTALTPTLDYTVAARNAAGSTETTLTLKISSTVPFVVNGPVNALLQIGSTLYLGGDFTQVGPPAGSAAMLDPVTGGKPGFAAWPLVNGGITAVTADPAHPRTFYVAGGFTQIGSVAINGLAKILPNGRPDPNWNPRPNGIIYMLIASANTLYVGGFFSSIGGQPRNNLAALDASTGLATDWNPYPQGPLTAPGDNSSGALAVQGNTVYVGGGFTFIGGQRRRSIAALDASTGLATDWNPDPSGIPPYPPIVYLIFVSGHTAYAGGVFSAIGGQPRYNLAALDVSTGLATDWNPHAIGSVYSLAINGKTLYAAGAFNSIGGQPRSGIAALDASTGLATDWNPNPNTGITRLAINGDAVYAGGGFTSLGGQNRNLLAAVDPSTGRATDWNPNPEPGHEGLQYTIISSLALSGSTIYVGGFFASVGGQSRNNIAALDASSGLATVWNPNANQWVQSLAVSGDTVYAGGYFTSVGGQPRNRIAALDASSGLARDFNPNADDIVSSIVVNGDIVYAIGNFRLIGGQPRNRLAALDASTGLATGWNPNPSYVVTSLVVSGDTVYVGGGFNFIGGQPRIGVAALDASTGLATDWNPNPNEWGYSLLVSGNTLYAGGGFTFIGGQTRNYFAAVDTSTGLATDWNPNPNGRIGLIAINGDTIYAAGGFSFIGGEFRSYFAVFPDGSDRAD